MMEQSAAHRAIEASEVFSPKQTISRIVSATELLISVMTRSPEKLHTALKKIAGRMRRHPVPMQVAIALGASVQPLTKMTPKVSTKTNADTGSFPAALQKEENGNAIKRRTPLRWIYK
jgi:hypothetical protein